MTKKSKMKAVTFTFPEDLHKELKVHVGSQRMSSFVVDAVREKLESEKNKLGNAYQKAEKDRERLQVLEDWDVIFGDHDE